MRGPRGGGRGSGGAVAGGLAAQSRTQAMLDNWGRDPAQQADDQAKKTRQEGLRKKNEAKLIEESLRKLKTKEEQLKKEQAPIIKAQQKEKARLEILKKESKRRDRLSTENKAFQAKQAEERAKVQAEEKARLEAEAKARREAEAQAEAQAKAKREAEAKAQAPKQANQAKDNPSLWHSLTKILLQQNDQNTNQQARPPKKTDDKKENSLPNWGALVSGLLNQQGEKKKPKPSPQKNPPPIDIPKPIGGQEIAPATTAPSNPIPQGRKTRASEYYSHSLDIYRLQRKFDDNYNISYNSIKNNKTYFDQRVAEWDAELKVLNIATREPRKRDEPREMGFEGYIKYLDSNIKQLQTQELTQKELESGKNPSVNQYQLKTLIAFHYLEMAKAFYSSGQLHMDKNDGDYQIKSKVFEGSLNYHEYLLDKDMKISIDSYKLPRIDGEENHEKRHRIEELRNNYLPKHRSRIESRNLAKLHAKHDPAPPKDSRATTLLNSAKGVLGDVKESFTEGLWEDYNLYGGSEIALAYKSAKEGVAKAGDFVGRGANAVADGIVWTGRRAGQAKGGVNAGEIINKFTGLGYANPNEDARAHDSRIGRYREQINEYQPDRDMRPAALASKEKASKVERYERRGNPVLQEMYSRSDGNFRIREGAGNPFAPGGRGGKGR